jgi:hypothetical protein
MSIFHLLSVFLFIFLFFWAFGRFVDKVFFLCVGMAGTVNMVFMNNILVDVVLVVYVPSDYCFVHISMLVSSRLQHKFTGRPFWLDYLVLFLAILFRFLVL